VKRQLFQTSVCLFLGIELSLYPPGATAQQDGQTPPVSASSNSQATSGSSTGISLPAPLGGLIPKLTSEAQMTEDNANVLTGRITANGLYTDNAFTSGGSAVGDAQYSIFPSLAWQASEQHTQWVLNYGGGLTLDQRIPGNTLQAQGGTADVRHNFSQRLTSELRQDFEITNNPFRQPGTSQSLPTVSGPGQLSPFAIPSPLTRTTSISTANLLYQLSPHSAMGMSGSYSLQHYRDFETPSGAAANLIDTTTASGRAFYVFQVSPYQTMGAEYQLQDLGFARGLARSVDQTLFLFDGISFGPNMSLVVYAGPQYTHTRNIVFLDPNFVIHVVPIVGDQWSLAGGLACTWQGKKTGLRLSGERTVGDGSGWLGAVQLNTGNFEIGRALTARWSMSFNLTYSDGRSLKVPAGFQGNRITTEQGTVGFSYRLSSNVTAATQYGRIEQPHAGLLTPVLNSSHNQILISLTYEFRKAFSR
jgi:hypothetical protein